MAASFMSLGSGNQVPVDMQQNSCLQRLCVLLISCLSEVNALNDGGSLSPYLEWFSQKGKPVFHNHIAVLSTPTGGIQTG